MTRRLSAAVVQDIAALIDVYKGYPQDKDRDQIRRIAQQRLGLDPEVACKHQPCATCHYLCCDRHASPCTAISSVPGDDWPTTLA